jgi:hypothetical protein
MLIVAHVMDRGSSSREAGAGHSSALGRRRWRVALPHHRRAAHGDDAVPQVEEWLKRSAIALDAPGVVRGALHRCCTHSCAATTTGSVARPRQRRVAPDSAASSLAANMDIRSMMEGRRDRQLRNANRSELPQKEPEGKPQSALGTDATRMSGSSRSQSALRRGDGGACRSAALRGRRKKEASLQSKKESNLCQTALILYPEWQTRRSNSSQPHPSRSQGFRMWQTLFVFITTNPLHQARYTAMPLFYVQYQVNSTRCLPTLPMSTPRTA